MAVRDLRTGRHTRNKVRKATVGDKTRVQSFGCHIRRQAQFGALLEEKRQARTSAREPRETGPIGCLTLILEAVAV